MFRKQTKYSSCQLIAAINARIILGGQDVTEVEYEALVDLVKCRHGAAIETHKAWEYLGLKVENGPVETMDLEWVRTHLPVEIGIYDPKYGFHSVLVVEVIGKNLRLINAWKEWANFQELEFPPFDYQRTYRAFLWSI